jgi:hypothetical protein
MAVSIKKLRMDITAAVLKRHGEKVACERRNEMAQD